jgi:hypothetical protein
MAIREEVPTVFTIASWDEKPYAEADGVKLTRAHFEKEYRGGVSGKSATEALMVYRRDGSASFVALERFEGAVRGRSGTLVIQSEGEFRSGVVESRGIVVAGAGTGELAGVTGEVPYKSGHASEYPIVFRVELG